MADLKRMIKVAKEYADLYKEGGLCGFLETDNKPVVQLNRRAFMECFDRYNVEARPCGSFPIQLNAVIDDVIFIALLNMGEVEKYHIHVNGTEGQDEEPAKDTK